ncbi:MAG TPA: transporter [Caballeronia sp.]|nr:transporter [Caballeronia sp.]
MRNHKINATALLLAACCAINTARATEAAGDTIGAGAEGFLAGALPPAGLYGVLYYDHYHASRFNDGNGHSSVPGFGLTADVVIPRLVYMSELTVLGGRVGGYALVALPSLNLNVAGTSSSRAGIGDTVVGPMLHWGAGGALQTVAALDLSLPTGRYDKNSALNLGKNYTSVRPIFAVSYLPSNGLEASAKFTYTFNTKNNATDYLSGQLFHFDYSISYAISSAAKLGINGYFIKQTTDDQQYGQEVGSDGFRGQALAIGPAFHYQFSRFGIEVRALKEYAVRNRPAGESLWTKAVFAF